MNNNIIDLLDLHTNESIQIDKIEINGTFKTIYLSKLLTPMYCPICCHKMHFKGFTKQIVNHPILQDGYLCKLVLNKRRWYCTSNTCAFHTVDEFPFAMRYQHNSNITPLLILDALKDPQMTVRDVASRFHVSDTYVHYTLLKYLNPKRLPLPKILSVDEVYLDIDYDKKYSLILMDFETGEIIDLLPSRTKNQYENYFFHIPFHERNNVEYIVCDMYNPYINFTINYLPKAKPVIDSFHVHQWINNQINKYIIEVKKKYMKRDRDNLKFKNEQSNQFVHTVQTSKEVYLLNHYSWVLLKNKNKIDYSLNTHWNKRLHQSLNTYDYEKMFLSLDDKFPRIRQLKELYVEFNEKFPLAYDDALKEINNLIMTYKNCDLSMFRDFAALLETYKDPICNSFINPSIYINEEEVENRLRRISNGPIESFNRVPKDMKRNARGYSNFESIRTRILWTYRSKEPILGTPRSDDEIHKKTLLKRGPYKKK